MMKAAFAATSSFVAVASNCPPQGFDSAHDFDLASYAAKPWYIQQQAATSYLPTSQNFCVSAEYTVLKKQTLLGYDIKVRNIAYEKSGKIHDSGDLIYAKIVDAKSGKLEVAPSFLPPALSGDYWVIAYDEAEGYALVSGGAPTLEGQGGLCRTGTGVNEAGLWIFTRAQIRNDDLVLKVRGIAQQKGFDLSVLNDVDQSHCPPLPSNGRIATAVAASSDNCPPAGFHSATSFDLAKYASRPWFIQQQAETLYLPEKENYCVSARYTVLQKKTLLGYDVKVRNVAYEKDGKIHDSGDLIYAKIVDANTGKLEVAPSFLPSTFAGDYWVIDYSEEEGYALISGGAPKVTGKDGLCRTGKGVNQAGLWIFTRQQTRNDVLVQKVRGIAQKMGFDLTVLNDVDQSNCPPLPESDMMIV